MEVRKCGVAAVFCGGIPTSPPLPLQVVLPHDGSCEDIDEAEMAQIRALGFLDW